jgi:hypothetical protein
MLPKSDSLGRQPKQFRRDGRHLDPDGELALKVTFSPRTDSVRRRTGRTALCQRSSIDLRANRIKAWRGTLRNFHFFLSYSMSQQFWHLLLWRRRVRHRTTFVTRCSKTWSSDYTTQLEMVNGKSPTHDHPDHEGHRSPPAREWQCEQLHGRRTVLPAAAHDGRFYAGCQQHNERWIWRNGAA